MNSLRTCSVHELCARMKEGNTALLDVREFPEYAQGHIEGARLIPMSALRKNPGLAPEAGEVVLICRTGKRAREVARLLCASGSVEPIVVEGGFEAWKQAGYPASQRGGPIALERQVRIAAGALVLTGLLVPGLQLLPYVVGAGLVFAGLTDTCGMAMLLTRLPWNRQKAEPGTTCPAGP